ncbi:MAG TPA: hypothetical protein VFQ67_15430 [Allosphingosinicella sp.]|jgi:hypothetical protein|nr:hypothetical protein [Allosphingosinicella sp.]
MIGKLIVLAVVALIAAPLVSLHQLGGIGVHASVRIVAASGGGVSLEALVAATRL